MRSILIFLTICLMTVTAWAASVPSPDTDTAEWLKALYTAFTSGDYKIGAGLVLVGIVAGFMKWTPLKPKSKLGKIALAFGVSLLGTLGLAFAADAPIALGTFITAISTAATAAGVWGWIKDWMASKKPAAPASSTT